MKILMVGDIVGMPGRAAFAQVAAKMKADGQADFVVANAENAAGGQGVTEALATELLRAGADVLTLGDHAWDQKEVEPFLDRTDRVLRPFNFAPGCPGRGWTTVNTPAGDVSVVNLIGRVFLRAAECPFRAMDGLLAKELAGRKTVLVDLHAEATSEKIAMGWYLDGRVSCVAGTHTHVQTSDERILPKGTGYITDLGMSGPRESVLGRDLEGVMDMFLRGMPARFKVAKNDVIMEGILVETDPRTGRATAIRRIRECV